jgi:hypothetical protein
VAQLFLLAVPMEIFRLETTANQEHRSLGGLKSDERDNYSNNRIPRDITPLAITMERARAGYPYNMPRYARSARTANASLLEYSRREADRGLFSGRGKKPTGNTLSARVHTRQRAISIRRIDTG